MLNANGNGNVAKVTQIQQQNR